METPQSARLDTEYIMTLYASMDPPQRIDDTFSIFAVNGGWAVGPQVNASIIQPAADWLERLPNACSRIDVRLTLKTDDGALIYVSYNGVIQHSETSRARLMKGEIVTSTDSYAIIAPTFRTSHAKYTWLNTIQAIGKLVELKLGQGSFIKYDVFAAN
jgi:hypothetical protein